MPPLQHQSRPVAIILVLLVARGAGMSRCTDELGTAEDAGRAGEGMADAGVEAHGWATGEGDGQPFVRAGRGFEGTCIAHRGSLMGGSFSVADEEVNRRRSYWRPQQ